MNDPRKLSGRRGLSRLRASEVREIKKILCMPMTQPFFRCPLRCKERGKEMGPPHNKQGHVCWECRCRNAAGLGSTGDFYGLGDHTGHLGLGYCWKHAKKMWGDKWREKNWEFASKQMRLIQSMGDDVIRGKGYEEYLVEEAKQAKSNNEARQGLEMVVKTLKEFENAVKDGRGLQKYVNGALVNADSVTRMQLGLKIADTLSSLVKDQIIITSDQYIHIDELKTRLPQQLALGKRLFMKLKESLLAHHEPSTVSKDPLQDIDSEYQNGMKEIWRDARTSRRKV